LSREKLIFKKNYAASLFIGILTNESYLVGQETNKEQKLFFSYVSSIPKLDFSIKKIFALNGLAQRFEPLG